MEHIGIDWQATPRTYRARYRQARQAFEQRANRLDNEHARRVATVREMARLRASVDRPRVPSTYAEDEAPPERAIAALVAVGLTNAEIAGRLALPEGVVGEYVESALRRLTLRGRMQLVAWSAEQELRDGYGGRPA